MTKHQTLLEYISELPVGTKISVRKIAQEMKVSDGTAYRAIKDAENKGLVSTIPKTGTIRIKDYNRRYSGTVTFAELIKIVNGTVLGGKEGLYKPLDRFLIGAMEVKDMEKYIQEGSILIVGNREPAHELALNKGAAVLISGGFETSEANKKLADKQALPIIKSPYDTYRIATLINQALNDKLLESEIFHIEDIMNKQAYYLESENTYRDWEKLMEKTEHSRFPVVDKNGKVLGMVTSKDVMGNPYDTPIIQLMSRNPITVSPDTLVASAAYVMVWEGIELIPVVDHTHCLVGVVSRQDVMEAMQFGNGQKRDSSSAVKTLVQRNFARESFPGGVILSGYITPAMTDHMGSLDTSVLTSLLTEASFAALGYHREGNVVLENCSFNILGPIQLEQKIAVKARVLDSSRKHGKVDLEITHRDTVLLKGFVSSQIF